MSLEELIYSCQLEGFDVYDENYVCWMQLYHPEAVPSSYNMLLDSVQQTTSSAISPEGSPVSFIASNSPQS